MTFLIKLQLELSRAHTPHALSIGRFLYRDRSILLMISTSPVVAWSMGVATMADEKTLFVMFVDRA